MHNNNDFKNQIMDWKEVKFLTNMFMFIGNIFVNNQFYLGKLSQFKTGKSWETLLTPPDPPPSPPLGWKFFKKWEFFFFF